ncbi:wall-associated receptor kinase-like 16 [Pyrus ussuriensis x Pyrus communis]|uniref:Wall-associated receptor kinase-like 16 n=1 Tax=Pyrus ussuriensis x Pyrus communis TaxID=2448454 RepID=A0A5N5F586_9ROSA|nr:wall-associated receptor kinase-like 16 [Pyrus ussuriensis x Pyrus communis]
MMKEEMKRNINGLIRRNGIPERLNQDVMSRFMEELFQENKVVYWDKLDWYHLVSCLPQDFKKEIKSYMPLTKLKKMSAFRYMDESVLKEICSHLQPIKYHLPTTAHSPFVITDVVEVLFLTASHMTSVATEFRVHFIKNYDRLVQNVRKDTFLRYFTEENLKRATRNYTEDRLGQILDGEINTDKFSFEMAKKVSELAVKCLRPWGEERPSMEEVAAEIEGVVQTIINRVEPSTVDDNISSASRTSE